MRPSTSASGGTTPHVRRRAPVRRFDWRRFEDRLVLACAVSAIALPGVIGCFWIAFVIREVLR